MEDNRSIDSIEEEIPETLAHEKTENESPAAKNPNKHKKENSLERIINKDRSKKQTCRYPKD